MEKLREEECEEGGEGGGGTFRLMSQHTHWMEKKEEDGWMDGQR